MVGHRSLHHKVTDTAAGLLSDASAQRRADTPAREHAATDATTAAAVDPGVLLCGVTGGARTAAYPDAVEAIPP